MATQVTKWQSKNGLLFESEAEAIQEDKTSEFRDWCSMNICCGGEDWSASMVATAILKEWEVVRKHKPAQADWPDLMR